MKNTLSKIVKLSSALLVAFTFTSNAAVITLNATERGWYNENGESNGASAGNNYIAGDCAGQLCNGTDSDLRNWFVFDLAGVSNVTAATLRLEVPASDGFGSTNDSDETYSLFDVNTNPVNLGSGNSIAVWQDLGEGSIFGSYAVSSSDLGSFAEISLNAIGLATLNLNAGFSFALGGSITTLDMDANDEYAFGFTFSTNVTELVLETQSVSAPSSILFIAMSLIGIGLANRKLNK